MIAALFAAVTAGQQIAGSPIAHVLVVIQENRTTDNLFASSVFAGGGPFPGANVTKIATINGQRIAMHATPFENPGDPDHSHAALVAEWNQGRMNGFTSDRIFDSEKSIVAHLRRNFTLAYVPAYETTLYHILARTYAWADNNFSPRLAPTFPGHLFLVAAQSQAADDPTDPVNWGCDSVPGTTVPLFGGGESEVSPGIFPCFDYQSIGDLLDRAHVTWKYYTAAPGTLIDANVNVYDAIKHVRYSPDWATDVSTPMSNVLSDIASCKLPQVAYVTPTWMNSDHAAELTNGGPAWVGSMYMALLQSRRSADPACRYYGNTAMILTWDDSGGWYDHVAPPQGPDGTHWGFRVPIVAISAWSKSGFISHAQRETTSILRYIERNWALGNLGQRDASGDDLSDLFDYARPQPIAPLSGLAVQRAIQASSPGWSLARSLNDTHPVDDDE